jgi:superfamily I DNA and/or RNA helicase
MMDAIRRIAKKKHESCALYGTLISGIESEALALEVDIGVNITMDSSLNSSQRKAVEMATQKNLTLIWGPPGTGKTTTIVHIIEQWRRISAHMDEPGEHILVAASTNNAVDNVLAKYISEPGISHEGIIRVCPDSSSVSKAVIRFWVGAFVDGDFNRPSAAMREAQKKVLQANIVFTTCTGAALGLLRKMSFTRVIIDEGSQITEPNCLITLVKGCQKLVLVGDHVQLRPTVTPLGRAYGYDISLFERLYTRPMGNEVGKVMLDTQYRMHPRMAAFPSARFYDGKLLSGTMAEARKPKDTSFNWKGEFIRFIEAPGLPEGQESFYHGSKSNKCQAEICSTIVSRLQQPQPVPRHSNTMPGITTDQRQPDSDDSFKMSLAVLTPYTAQLKLLQNLERRGAQSSTISSVTVATVDSFQGREADIVVFCTVRCNASHSIGFLADERRMNVALTRARRGLIVVGHRESLVQSEEGGPFWRSWFESLGRRAVSRE